MADLKLRLRIDSSRTHRSTIVAEQRGNRRNSMHLYFNRTHLTPVDHLHAIRRSE